MSSFIYSNFKHTIFRTFAKTKVLLTFTSTTITEITLKQKIQFQPNFQQDAKLTLTQKKYEAIYNITVTAYCKKARTLLYQKAKNPSLRQP